MNIPKVSVVVPCYNVERTLEKCLDSIVNQTLKDIEIICVNDGSKDSTLRILQQYAARDSRVRIIDKVNTGYGNSMNRGFDLASGEYLGIIESDDFAEPDMYEKLYACAKQQDLDVVRAGYFHYVTSPEESNTPVPAEYRFSGLNVFCPTKDLKNPHQMAAFFSVSPAIWSAIYRREFIVSNGIRFNETPGASYQDTGFRFKVWIHAKRVKLMKECLLHYRIDNASSSIHSPGKVYCICDEYQEMERFLKEQTTLGDRLMPLLLRLKYQSFLWNYERLSPELQEEFIPYFNNEFRKHADRGELTKQFFNWFDWNNLQKILLDPQRYHMIQMARSRGDAVPDFYDAYPEKRPVPGKRLYKFVDRGACALKLIYERGMADTVTYFVERKNSNTQQKVGADV